MKCKVFSAVVTCLLSAILSASPDPMISITPVTRSMMQEGGTGAINTSGSGTWTASVSADWIMIVGGTSGSAGYAVGYTVSANNNVEARTGHVYVSGHVHTITQSGIGAELENDTASFESAGGSGQVTVIAQAGKGWTARSNVSWITLNKTEGVGTSSLSYTVAPYQEVSTRVGTLIVAGETFTVSQTGCRMQLSSYEVTSDYLAESFKVRVNALATTEWSVETTASWVTIDDAGNGIGADSIKFSISENESYSPRTATIQIGTERFTVTQLGRTSLVFRLSEKEALYGVDGVAEARVTVSATPDLGWQAQSDCDWIEIYSSYVTGSGDGTIVYKVKANPTLYARSGTITVRAEDDAVSQKRIDVSQAAAEAALTMDGFEFEAGGEEARVGVNTGAIVGWNVINTNNWLSVSGVPAAGSAVLTLVASPNPTVEVRSGVLMIADRSFTVSQKGRGVSVDYTARVFNTDGKTTGMDAENVIRVTAESDVSWTAEASDATWIVIYEGKSGKGNGIIKYIVAPYLGSGEMRTGTIRVGDQTVYITQRPYALSIEPNGAIMDANAGAGEIQVALDIEGVWNAIATEPWITVKSGYDAGTGSGRVIFTYTDNNTGKERTGKIIIAGEEYTLTQAARQNIAITTSVEGTGGFVEGGGIYNVGTEVQLKAVAESGCQFVSWSLPDGSTSDQAIINVVAAANATYTARFGAIAPILSVVSTSLQGVKLSWQNIAWAVNYNIWRNSTSSKASAVKIATLKSDGLGEYLDATGTENQVYWYWVEAVGASDSKWSNGVEASRQKQLFNITYKNLRGTTHTNPSSYLEGDSVVFSAPTSRRGYTFVGWTPEAILPTFSGDVTTRAVWMQNEYSVHFDLNGGTGEMADQSFTYGYWKYLSETNVVKSGYRFTGWATSASGEVVYSDKKSLKNLTAEMHGLVTLYAVWRAYIGVEGDDNATVTGDEITGFVIKPSGDKKEIVVLVPEGFDAGKVTIEVDPTVASLVANGAQFKIVKNGHDITPYLSIPFSGSKVYPSQSVVKDDFVKEALDPIKGVEIILDPDSPSITLPYTRPGLTYTLKEGRTVNGLEDGDSKLGDGQPWSPRITVKGGQSAFYSITVNLNDVSSHPTPPVPEPIVYTIRFDANGGVGDTLSSYNAGSTLGELPTPSREGYTFVGWFTAASGGDAVTSETVVTADMTIYAHWTIKSYVVTFYANGGSGSVSKSYNHGASLGELPVSTREGYEFVGWFTAASGGTQVTTSTIVTANITIYAQWTINSYAVEFNANGGNGGVTKSYTHGATLGELPKPMRDGYKFLGWFMADEGGVAVTSETVVTADMTIYARWEPFDTHESVQLWEGGPYWATTNIGAENPEDYGYYFWWGDTVGYKRENDKWVASDGSSSNFSFNPGNAPTYGKSIATLQSEGWITANSVLAPAHDAAKKHWGGDWRMPTDAEFFALINNCTTTWTTRNGAYGRLVTGKGAYADRSIFLPAAGGGDDSYLYNAGSDGRYWQSTSYSDDSGGAWYLYFGSSGFYRDYRSRYGGRSVRPVRGFAE